MLRSLNAFAACTALLSGAAALADDPSTRFDPLRLVLKVPVASKFTFKGEHVLLPNTTTTAVLAASEANKNVQCWLVHASSPYERVIRAGTVASLWLVAQTASNWRQAEFKMTSAGGNELLLACYSPEGAEAMTVGALVPAFGIEFAPQEIID